MAGHHVRAGQVHVVVDHPQAGVAEDALQCEHIAAGLEVRHRKRVAKQVDRQPCGMPQRARSRRMHR